MKAARRGKHVPRHIAPRLQSGERRVPSGNALPPIVKFALRQIADQENRSLSWVVEEILLDWARHDRRLARMLKGNAVAYIPRKNADEAEAEVKERGRRERREADDVDRAVADVARAAATH